MVPQSLITAMGIAILLMIGILVGMFFLLRRKFKIRAVPIFIGVLGFVIFAMFLEQKLHMLVLKPTAAGLIPLRNEHPWLYVLYGILAAGIFEETARFIGFHLLKDQYPKFATSLAYGLGHGGIEMILVGLLSLVSSLVVALLLKDPNGTLATEMPSTILASFQNTSASQIYLSVVERFGALVIQLCLSIFVWLAVNRRGKLWFYPLAIGIHALVDTPSAMLQAGLLKNTAVVYLLLYIMAGLLVWASSKIYQKEAD